VAENFVARPQVHRFLYNDFHMEDHVNCNDESHKIQEILRLQAARM